jgi:YfiH family protein
MADCQCILLYDPEKKVIANIHSGWKGSIRNIIGITIDKMIDVFACNPCNINAGISPSLGLCCAEFINYEREIPIDLWKYKNEISHFDFWSLSYDQLISAGLLAENIYISKICTKCNSKIFYSYRRSQRTGRFAGFIGLC